MKEAGAVNVGKEIPQDKLLVDLERYRQEAIRLGMTDAKIITTSQIFVDERVRGKCRIPLCVEYGVSANCPPLFPDSGRDPGADKSLRVRYLYEARG